MLSHATLADLLRVYHIAVGLHREESNFKLSAHMLLEAIKEDMHNTEVASVEEARDLLRVLSFRLAHLHSDHYYNIGNRDDVMHHLSLFAPFYLSLLRSSNVVVFCGDATNFNENDHSNLAWIPMCEKNSDLAHFGTGVGLRMNVFEFACKEGIVFHPDGVFYSFPPSPLVKLYLGRSAGTIYPFGTTQDADDIYRAVQRFVAAVRDAPRYEGKLKVLLIDGAPVNKTLPDDAINPSKVCITLSSAHIYVN
jgi:hypothetical protein